MSDGSGSATSQRHASRNEQLELLVRISEALSASLDISAIAALGELLVPDFADACAIDVINLDGSVTRIATAHAVPSKRALLDTMERFLPELTAHPVIAEAVATGTPILAEALDDQTLVAGIDDPAYLAALTELGIRSGMVIPLRGRDRPVGVITLARTDDSGRRFDETELRLAEDIARLAALSVANATLIRGIEESRGRYRMLVDSVDAVVWEADPKTLQLTFVSERAEKLLGYPASRWLDDPSFLESVVLPDDRAWVTEQRRTAIASGDGHEIEYRAVTADGRVIWLHDRLSIARGDEGPTAVRGLSVDVSERKLWESKQRAHLATARVFAEATSPAEIPAGILRALLDTLGWDIGTIWQVARDTSVLRCIEFVHAPNRPVPAFEAATWRLEFQEGVGLPGRVLAAGEPAWIEDVTTDENFPRAEAARRSDIRGAFAFPIIAEGKVQGVLEFFTRETRRPDEGLLQLVGDVGVQMGQFIRRRELEEELRRNESHTRAIIESALDAIITMDGDGSIVGVNPRAAELFGFEPGEVIGRPLADVIIPPSFRDAHRAGLRRFIETGKATVIGRRLELPALRADGSEFPVELSIAVRREDGDLLFIGFMRDMTEQRTAEQRRITLHAVTRVLAESDSLSEATSRIVETICRTLGWEIGLLWTPTPDDSKMRWVAGWHDTSARADLFLERSRAMTFAPGEGVIGRIWETRHPLWLRDVTTEPNFVRAHTAAKEGLRSVFGIPIVGSGSVLGVLEFYSHDIREPDEDLQRMMSGVGIQIGSFIERQRAQEESAYQRTLLASQSEASIDGILVLSAENRILTHNRRFVEMWRLPDDVLGDDEATLEAVLRQVTDHDATLVHVRSFERQPDAVHRDEITLQDGRTFDRYTAPVVGEDGVRYGRMWTFRDITDQKRTERALQESTARSTFLAEISAALVGNLDPETMLGDVARLAVPTFADWCAVDLVRADGTLDRVALEHRDRDEAAALEALRARTIGSKIDPNAPRGAARVIATGRSELEPEVLDEWLVEAARGHDDVLAALRELGLRSYICVPLNARGRIIGAITFASATSGRTYDAADLWLVEDLARRVAIAIDNARLYEETQHVAKALQQSLIPPALPEITGVDAAARFAPAGRGTEVGGDFYDLFSTGRNDWAIVMGDVCGKGADAAAVTALARYTIRASAMQTKRPQFILTQLNQALIRQRGDERFCTVAYGRLRRYRGAFRLTSSSGGHPLPLVLRSSGEIEEIGAPGMILGAFGDVELKERTVTLEAGDAVIFYTDGVTEAGSPHDMLGEDGLAAVLRPLAGAPAAEIADALVDAAAERAPEAARDDVAVVVLRIRRSEGRDGAGEGIPPSGGAARMRPSRE